MTRLFRIGGAHAIAALAYGTETIPRVDKIVGPGNALGRGREGARLAPTARIDFYAGPTEIVVVVGDGRRRWIAADLIAQAEHDPDARADSDHADAGPGRRASRGRSPARCRPDGPAPPVAARATAASSSRGVRREAIDLVNAPRRNIWSSTTDAAGDAV